MKEMVRDLGHAARRLRRDPLFTVVALLTLALGFGATIGMFSVMNALLLKPLPVHQPDRLVRVTRATARAGSEAAFAYPAYLQIREPNTAFSGIAAFTMTPVSLGDGDGTRRAVITFVSDNYFEVLGVAPAAGRFLAPADGRPGAFPVVVLGWDEWQRHFAGSRSVIGQPLRVNGVAATVVGVAPPGFNGVIGMLSMDAWASFPTYRDAVAGASMEAPNRSWLSVFGRLAPGVGIQQAGAALTPRLRSEGAAEPGGSNAPRIILTPLRAAFGSARAALTALTALLLATAVLVLGIASTNVAGLMLARSLAREKEFALRAALGASRGRLLVQSLAESALLWVCGAGLGLMIAVLIVKRLPGVMPVQRTFPVRLYLDTSLDARVLVVASVVSLIAGLAFGAVPALRASSSDLMLLLRDGAGPGRSRSWVHGVALAAQAGGSVLLLIIAGLFARSMQHATKVDPGFEPDGVAWAAVDVAAPGVAAAPSEKSLHRMAAAMRDDPRASSVAVSSEVPLGGSISTTGVRAGKVDLASVRVVSVSGGYFRTLRIPILKGRDFQGEIGEAAGGQAIVSRTTAARLWPGDAAVGRHLELRNGTWTVVGVVGDVQSGRLGEAAQPVVYLPYSPDGGEAHFFVRSRGSVRDATGVLQRGLSVALPGAPVNGPAPLRDVILSSMPQGALAGIVGGFSVLGLLLTTIGLFGAVSFFIVQGTREIGIRAALGASPTAVARFVAGRGAGPALSGVLVGLALALGSSRLLRSFFSGLNPWDPATFVVSLALIATVGGSAALVPALRVARRSPARNLHAR
ncbi:MAG TPA: ADOP family duplicated permease [Longimicrobium sp.]